MTGTRILYISGSIGLGHARQRLAIARELRTWTRSRDHVARGGPGQAPHHRGW